MTVPPQSSWLVQATRIVGSNRILDASSGRRSIRNARALRESPVEAACFLTVAGALTRNGRVAGLLSHWGDGELSSAQLRHRSRNHFRSHPDDIDFVTQPVLVPGFPPVALALATPVQTGGRPASVSLSCDAQQTEVTRRKAVLMNFESMALVRTRLS